MERESRKVRNRGQGSLFGVRAERRRQSNGHSPHLCPSYQAWIRAGFSSLYCRLFTRSITFPFRHSHLLLRLWHIPSTESILESHCAQTRPQISHLKQHVRVSLYLLIHSLKVRQANSLTLDSVFFPPICTVESLLLSVICDIFPRNWICFPFWLKKKIRNGTVCYMTSLPQGFFSRITWQL